MTRTVHGRRTDLLRVLTLSGTAALLLAGCGGEPTQTDTDAAGDDSSVDDGGNGGGGSGGGSGGGGGGPGGGGSGGGGEEEYDWSLPAGDNSVGGGELGGYARLQQCDGAVRWIEERWEDFESPRNVLLYIAGAYACQGDDGGAAAYYRQAVSAYGLGGVDRWPNVCSVHRSLVSVLEQRPRDDVDCPGGDAPEWRWDEDFSVRDHPLTFDVDESVVTTEENGTGENGTGENGTEENGTEGTQGTEEGTEGTTGETGTDGDAP